MTEDLKDGINWRREHVYMKLLLLLLLQMPIFMLIRLIY